MKIVHLYDRDGTTRYGAVCGVKKDVDVSVNVRDVTCKRCLAAARRAAKVEAARR